MRKLRLILLIAGFTCAAFSSFSQLPIGQWRDHLMYKQAIAVAESPSKVFVGTESAVFEYSKNDNAVIRLSKVNGLSDIGVSTLGVNPYNNVLIIGYKNGNIDVLDNSVFYNLPDIKRSPMIGNKKINSVYFNGRYAYLACGFGIICFDTERREIKDTYYIGTNGGRINIRDITINNNIIYAASDSGLYSASLSSPNLADFTSWSSVAGLRKAIYNTVCAFNGNVYTNLSSYFASPSQINKDTLFFFNGSAWNYFPADTTGFIVNKITSGSGRLVVTYSDHFKVFDTNYNITDQAGPFQTNYYMELRYAVINAQNNTIWAADYLSGLIKFNCQGWCNQRFVPDGPVSSKVYSMDFDQGKMWVAPGERDGVWIGQYNADGVMYFSSERWGFYNMTNTPALTPVRDIVSVTIDPQNSSHVYAGCLGKGLLEFNNNGLVNIFNETNSSLQVRGDAPTSGWVGVFGSRFDKDGNLWVSNSLASNPLSVRKTDGSWQSFNFNVLPTGTTMGSIIVSSRNKNKWIVLPRGGGILVFNENGTWSTGDDRVRKLGFTSSQGGIPGSEVNCIAEDKDGEIWIGSDRGISVFYSPDNVFSPNTNAQQILIQQDGHTQLLLETEQVTAIAVDGANRKWIGTQNAGVFLMSADGTQQIYHFDETNSPLLSNTITSIVINGENGEVFFGTAKGIISYRSTATEGLENFTDVYAFPNPVRPGYGGPIAIKGLVKDCDVKITDITGTLVYQTKALGGQAIWDGKNFNGDRAHSGVYLVFCSNEDGSKTFVTKICLVN